MSLYPDLKEISVRIDGDDVAVVMLDRPVRHPTVAASTVELMSVRRRLNATPSPVP